MLACVDVAYEGGIARAGCLVFADWSDATALAAFTATADIDAEYAPGEFYRRELPPLLLVLAKVRAPLEVIVVDGYVWLPGRGPGLGARLHQALERRVAIVGVAKNAWTRAPAPDEPAAQRVVPVVRGSSARPLFVTAAGMDPEAAAAQIARMHGKHRLPTLLKAVDRLARAS